MVVVNIKLSSHLTAEFNMTLRNKSIQAVRAVRRHHMHIISSSAIRLHTDVMSEIILLTWSESIIIHRSKSGSMTILHIKEASRCCRPSPSHFGTSSHGFC